MGCQSLQGIFTTQGSNLHLLHCTHPQNGLDPKVGVLRKTGALRLAVAWQLPSEQYLSLS